MRRIYRGRVEPRKEDLWSLRGGQGDGYRGEKRRLLEGNQKEDRGEEDRQQQQSVEGLEDPWMKCQQKGVTRYRVAGYVRWRGPQQNEDTWPAGRAGPELEAGGDLVHVQVALARLMGSSAAWRLRAMGLDSCAWSLERTWLTSPVKSADQTSNKHPTNTQSTLTEKEEKK